MLDLSHFGEDFNAVIVGASGGIGHALCEALLAQPNLGKLYALSRSGTVFNAPKVQNMHCDFADEATIASAATEIAAAGQPHLIIVATGILQDDRQQLQPEKSLRDISLENFHKSYLPNLFGPALVAKHFLPLLPKDSPSLFAALSARVASIEDNEKGGWYAYRSGKTALNMILKNAAIEMARSHKHACIIGLHPGTVDTALSKPFQGFVKHEIFSPKQAADYLLAVISQRTPADSGKVFDWKGEAIPA